MKCTKRLLSMLLAITLLLTATVGNGLAVNAATDISTAKTITVNSSTTGYIEEGYSYEKDYYKFTISQSGYVTVNFTNSSPSSSTSEAWEISLLTNYAADTITSSVARLKDSTVSLTTIGLPAGTYYICVQSTGSSSAESTNNYTIKAAFTAASDWEKEFNSTTETANSISTNKTYYGTIHDGYSYDKDYYKFTTANDGYVTLDFTNSNPTSSTKEAWEVTLYGFGSDALTEIISKVITTNKSKVSLTTVGLPAGTYYVCVRSVYSSSVVSNSKYGICVNYTESNDWEQEFNEEISTSNVIDVNKTYYGTIRNGYSYEKDYYKFETADDGYVTVDFTNSAPSSSSSQAWTVILYGFSSSTLTEITRMVVQTNNSKMSLTTVGLPKGTYYVCVKSEYSSSVGSDSKYGICVNYTVSTTWEKEFNEDSSTATRITTQEKYTGTIHNGYSYEKDYYRFTTTGSGTIDITFYNDTASTSTSTAWNMYVYDSTLTKLESRTVKRNDTSVAVQLTGKAAGTYYICVQSTSSSSAVADTPYQLKVVGPGIPVSVDTTKPTGGVIYGSYIDSASTSQTVRLMLSDDVGVVSYYWGTSSSPSSGSYTSITSATSKSVDKTVSSAGTYYLLAKDAAGNTSDLISVTFYKTTLNGNGVSASPSYVIGASGTSFTLPTLIRTGYSFLGWSTSSTATSATYQPGASYTSSGNRTLYAVWKVNTAVLSANSSNSAVISTGGEMKQFTFTPGTSGKYVIYSTGSDDTRVYLYDANGTELDSDDDDGDSNNFRLEYSLTAGTTYTFGVRYYNSSKTGTISFKFGNIFTVTYNANGGSGAPSAQSKDYGTSITLSSTAPVRSGYTFLGWSTSATATSAAYQPGGSFSVNANTTLYAVWEQGCENGAHSYSYKTTKTPTTSATGTLTGTCSKCSATTTVTLPKLSTADYNYSVRTAATCTAAGSGRYTWKTTTYGTFYFDVSVAATGHNFENATCTEPQTCSACGATQGKALGHSWQAATCTTPKTCSVCGTTEGKAQHSWGNGITLTNPTCTAAGMKAHMCSVCGTTQTESTDPLGHSYSSVTTAPTCTQQGYTTYTCATCGDVYKADYTGALGHKWSTWLQTKAPTCTAEGSELRFCNCGAQETRTIAKLLHSFANGVCSACGYKEQGSLAGMTMSLGNSLAANFVVMKTYAKGEGNYAVITKEYADKDPVTVTIPQSDWEAYGNNGYYIAFAGVTAKEMTDEFTVNIYNANGEQVIATYVRTIEGYCYDQLVKEEAKASPDAEKLALYVDILKYGAAAQVFFDNYNIDNLATARLSEAQLAYGAGDVDMTDIRVKGEGYMGSTLSLKSEISMNFVFKNATIGNAAYATFSFTNHYGELKEKTIQAADFQAYGTSGKFIVIDGMSVADCSAPVTVVLYDADGNVLSTTVDSVEAYIARMSGAAEVYPAILKLAESAYNSFH